MLKSYYEILNVAQTATKDEIKKQFKKLVKMYHPDINQSIEAEQIFKSVNRAAEILLDDNKRKNYDKLRAGNKNTFKKSSNQNKSNNYTFSDIFKKEKPHTPKKPQKGDDITLNIEIDYQEAILGTTRSVNIARCAICPKCMGHKFVNGQKCSYCDGLGEKTVSKKITVKIPPSIKNKAKLRLKGEGQEGKFGGEAGNLYIIVNIKQKNGFEIKDGTVYAEAQISPYTAIFGGNIKVETLWGEAFIKIPPLTKANQSFKLVDVGVLDEKTNKKGDEIVKIVIQIPNELTKEEYALYEKLKEINLQKKNARTI